MIYDTLNDEQRAAVELMIVFARDEAGLELLLEGPAGTGKTYCMKALVEKLKKRIIFTAPTNKAVRVLREAIASDDYTPKCKTIYSLLGLVLAANGEVKELKQPEDPVDLSEYSVVVVDEASMVNTILRAHINSAQSEFPRLKWIFMGDRNQLPPVGEDQSLVWSIKNQFQLTQIMRHDNTILQLATHVRGLIGAPNKALGAVKDTEDVHWLSVYDFSVHIRENAAMFLAGRAKAISWRNVRVDEMNKVVRRQLFAEPDIYPWQPGDRITTLEPVNDPTKERGDFTRIVAVTDDEGVVEKTERANHPKFPEFACWRVLFRRDDNQMATLWVLHSQDQGKYERRKAELAAAARTDKRKWFQFWEFQEGFARVRHAYAITAHKSQGSTYERAYVNWRDIMLNDNRVEAYKCLYVAVTRAKKEVYLG